MIWQQFQDQNFYIKIYVSYDIVLELRKHIKNIHTNKNTTSKLGKIAKGDENEVIVDVGQGFTRESFTS